MASRDDDRKVCDEVDTALRIAPLRCNFKNLAVHWTWINSRLLKSKSFAVLGCPPHSIPPSEQIP
jgi:hypothetical protein